MSAKVHRLVLCNFKSYNGKVDIGPFHDFSCIVGLNGAGKSNVMDALSFVLGAGAETLRGRRWEDLVNRAAKKGSECSVTLVLRLAAGSEVALTRCINSRGQTTTLVDGAAVAEHAFTAVLRQHRIGKRVGSYLVFQHEVDAVAHKKARELTDLIEEVSGSGELKAEYAEKRRALEQANEQLANATLEKRGAIAEVNQMRLHKKEAERFEEISGRLEEERRDLALCELFAIESELAHRKEEQAAAAVAAEKLGASVASEEQVRRMKKDFADNHKTYLEALKSSREAAVELREKKGTLDRIQASIEHFQRRLEKEKEELAAAKESSTTRSKEMQRLEQQIVQQETLLAEFEAACRREDAEAAKAGGKFTPAQLVEYKKLKTAADCETITARQELEVLRRQRDSVAQGLRQTEVAAEGADAGRQDLAAAVQRQEERAREADAKRLELERGADELKEKADQARASLAQVQARAREKAEKLQALDAQLNELRFVKDDNKHAERIAEALAALQALHGGGIRGRLVDLVTIPNARYRNAVTVAFGKNLDAIVVDTTETAMACVRHLKEQRIAAMTFIPLASAQGKGVDDRLRTFGGTCKPIVDVLKFDPSLDAAIRYSIGETLVCDSMDEARRVAFQQADGSRHKVVTLDGSMLLKNGSIQGGLATVQARARKWDERQYDTLKAARDEVLRDAEAGADEARGLVEARDLESRREFATGRASQLKQESAAAAAKARALQAEVKKHDDQIAQHRRRAQEYAAEIAKVEGKMAAVQKTVSDQEGAVFADFKKRTGIHEIAEVEQREVKAARARAERRQHFTIVIHKLRSSLESEAKRIGARNPKEQEALVARTNAELATCQTDLASYKKIFASAQARQETAQAKLTQAKTAVDQLEETIRKHGKTSESDQRALQNARKVVTLAQAACDALRQKRLSIVQRCRMEEIALPMVAATAAAAAAAANGGEGGAAADVAAAAGRKRPRAEEGARPKRGRGGAAAAGDEGDDDETVIRISEAFASTNETSDAAASANNAGAAPRLKRGGGGSDGTTTTAGGGNTMLCVDFTGLPESLRATAADRATFAVQRQRVEQLVEQLERELESLAPNLKATARFTTSEAKLGTVAVGVDEARDKSRRALVEFAKIKDRRTKLFMDAFEKISENVDRAYRDLTLGTRSEGVHGSAYLVLEDAEDPFNGGTKYHATPPMKRFMTMELLSGGERTMAALALLFAIHSISPAPFFVLDEVDAALDAANVGRLSMYLRTHSAQCQFIVVSLKDELYHVADSLLGIYKDLGRESSGVLTLDLRGVAQ